MKKLLSILMLLVTIVTGAKAEDFTITPLNGSNGSPGNIAKLSFTDNCKISSGNIEVTKSKSSTVTFSTNAPDMYIKSVTFTDVNNSTANKKATVLQTSTDGSTASTSAGVYTFTGGSGITSVTYSVTAGSGGAAKLGSVSIVVSNGSSNNLVTMSTFSKSNDAITASNVTCNGETVTAPITLSSTEWSVSSNNIYAPSSNDTKTITITSENKIKYIAFVDSNCRLSLVETSTTGGTVDGASWTAPTSGSVKSVTFKNGISTSLTITKIYVITESAGPVDPEFTLTKTSIGTNETSQIQVNSKGNLDGIALSNLEYDNTKISIDENGVVTPLVAGGPYSITFTSAAVSGKYNAGSGDLSLTVTAPKYTVQYELNGGNGTAPTQADTEEGGKFNLAAAPTKDFSTFAGWLCDADNQVYAAGAEYEMTAKNTKFTAQWTVTTYSSTLDFAAETIKRAVYGATAAPTGEKAFTNINTFLESGNMIGTSGLSNNNWEPSDQKTGFIGYKLKVKDASVKFMAKAGKKVTITFGSIAAKVTLRKNGVDSEISANSGEQVQTVVSFDAEEDMLVEIVTSSGGTVTLNKIAIEDAAASYTVNVGTTGFATVGLPFVTTVPSGVTAYTVSSVSGSTVVLSQEEAGATIPAYKGIIIVAEPGDYTFTEKVVDDTYTGNTGSSSLLATGAVTRNAATTAGEFYYFGIIDSTKRKVGFKKIAVGGTISDHKAYLPGTFVTNNTNSLSISFEGEATAINGIAEAESDADAPAKVIKNGKLYIGNYNVAGQLVK